MKTIYYICLLILTQSIVKAQSSERSGYIKYDMIINFVNADVLEATLFFDQQESYFIWKSFKKSNKEEFVKESKVDERNVDIVFNKTIHSDSPAINYKSLKKNQITTRMTWLDNKTYLVQEKLPKLKWKIENQRKKISNFNCQKAVAYFRGRTYTAWFTLEIPVSSGPWKLQGLPGMIIEAHDDKNEIWFGAKEISYPTTYTNIDKSLLESQNVITIAEYAELQSNAAEQIIDKESLSKRLKSQLPRGTTVTVDVQSSAKFIELEFDDIQN